MVTFKCHVVTFKYQPWAAWFVDLMTSSVTFQTVKCLDAPELHYRPTPPLNLTVRAHAAFLAHNACFRQHLAIASVTARHARLTPVAREGVIRCVITTQVATPDDVFDTYGRFVGDLVVGRENINHWLVRSGWAFPAFYTSMTSDEIRAIATFAHEARAARRGVWKTFARTLSLSDLRYPPEQRAKDAGPVAEPKLFRRFCAWRVAYFTEGA